MLSLKRSGPATAADVSPPQRAPANPGLLNGRVWRDAAVIWLAQRLFLLVFASFGLRISNVRVTPWSLLMGWYHWDADIYATIARAGYQHPLQSAFYPMLPGLEHVTAPLVGGNTALAGIIIANVAALLTLGLLRALVEREFDRAVARRTLVYLVTFPTAFFLITPYTESLFLLFSVASFVALRREHWLTAGLFAALAALTRPVGILLIAPILVEYLMSRRAAGADASRRTAARLLIALALPALAVGGFVLALHPLTGFASPVQSELATGWGRNLTLPGVGFVRAGAALLAGPNALQSTHIALDAAFTVLLVALSVALWRRLPHAYVVYTWLSTAVILMTPSNGWLALASNMRFMLVLFPLFMLLGQWGKRPWVNVVILACAAPLLALQTAIYIGGGWVA